MIQMSREKWSNCDSLDPQLSSSVPVNMCSSPLKRSIYIGIRSPLLLIRQETIDFYVEVMSTSKVDGSDSWTHKLWRDAKDGLVTKVSINGPYGSGFNDISDRTQILGIGSGTGIVRCSL